MRMFESITTRFTRLRLDRGLPDENHAQIKRFGTLPRGCARDSL